MNQELREMFVADKDKAPEWLKEALERWEREDS